MSLRRMPLRHRATLAFTLLGLCLSLIFSAAVAAIAEDYEYVLAAEILSGQAEDYGLRMANGLPAQLPRTHRLSGYRVGDRSLPAAYARMPPGVREDEASHDMHVGVFDTQAGRLVFVIDLSDIEASEIHLRWFLAGMIVIGTSLSGWLGWWFAGRVLRPVRVLADKVDTLPLKPAHSHLAGSVSQDELGRLAQAVDDYQNRLADADRREQAFFADASHELRTPLTIVQGVTEVLMDEPDIGAGYRQKLKRLERGVSDMGQLLDILFSVARRSELRWESVDAQTFLLECAELAAQGTSVSARIQAEGTCHVPRKEALLLVAGLIRKIAQQPGAGELLVRLESGELLIAPTVEQAGGNETPLRSDTGRGSELLSRLAAYLGWRIVFENPLRTRLELPTP